MVMPLYYTDCTLAYGWVGGGEHNEQCVCVSLCVCHTDDKPIQGDTTKLRAPRGQSGPKE